MALKEQKKRENDASPDRARGSSKPKDPKSESGWLGAVLGLLIATCCAVSSLGYAYVVMTDDGPVKYEKSFDLNHPVAHSLLHDDHFEFLRPIISSMENDIVMEYLDGTVTQEMLSKHMELLKEEANKAPGGTGGLTDDKARRTYKPTTDSEVAEVDRISIPSEWDISWMTNGFECPKSYSVIIPMRNTEKFLKYSLEALYRARQMFHSNMPEALGEVIIIDDCSTDQSVHEVGVVLERLGATYEIYEDLESKGSMASSVNSGWQIWLLGSAKEYGRGQSKVRNLGAERSSGDILYFLDADDEMDANHIYNCFRGLSIYRYAAVCKGGVGLYDGDNRDAEGKAEALKIHPTWVKPLENVLIGNTAVRRQVHKHSGGFPEYDHYDLYSSNKIYGEDELYLRRINCFMRVSVSQPALRYMRYSGGPGGKGNSVSRQFEMMAHNYAEKDMRGKREVSDDRYGGRSKTQFPTKTTKEVVSLAREEVDRDIFAYAKGTLFYTSFFLQRSGIKKIQDSLQMEGLQFCVPLEVKDASIFSPGVAPKQEIIKDTRDLYGKIMGYFVPYDDSDSFQTVSVVVAATMSAPNAKKSLRSIQNSLLALSGADSTLSSILYEIVVAIPKEYEEYHEGYWENILEIAKEHEGNESSMSDLLYPWRVEILPYSLESYGVSTIFNAAFDLTFGNCLFFFDMEGKAWDETHVKSSMKRLIQGASSTRSPKEDSNPSDFINSLAFRRSAFMSIKGLPLGHAGDSVRQLKPLLTASNVHVEL